jgi:hypothetical protein
MRLKQRFFLCLLILNLVYPSSEMLMDIENVEMKESTSARTFFSKFHIFDVGQGNSQFIYYPKQKTNFLYNADSASKISTLNF